MRPPSLTDEECRQRNGLALPARQISENNFKPDLYTCNILLQGLCKVRMLEKAIDLFNSRIDLEGKMVWSVAYPKS